MLRIKAIQHFSEDTAAFPISCARENMQRQNKYGKSARKNQNKKKISQTLMEHFRGTGCQFWVQMAPAQNAADCSEWGFHQPDFGVGSQLPCVLCSFQNQNPGPEQPRAAGGGCRLRGDLSQALSQVSHKRWRSTLSPCLSLPDSPISLTAVNQWKLGEKKALHFCCSVINAVCRTTSTATSSVWLLLSGMNYSLCRHCLHSSHFFCLGFERLKRCRSGEKMLYHI